MSSSKSGVLFDVDGTLCDTNYLHAACWARALRDHGFEAQMAVIHRHIGMGSDRFTKEVVGEHSDEAGESHRKYYKEMWRDIRPFEGAADLLRAVRAKGVEVVLASSADADELQMLRERIDAEDAIGASTSSGDAEASKPAPDIFLAALEASDLDRDQSIVVGDTVWDVYAAKDAGLQCIGFLSGGFSAAELTEAGAIAIYEGPNDLLAGLDESPLARLWQNSPVTG